MLIELKLLYTGLGEFNLDQLIFWMVLVFSLAGILMFSKKCIDYQCQIKTLIP